MKRLKGPSGLVAESQSHEGDSDDKVVREAIVVHAGAEKSAIEFASSDGPIVFDEARIKRVVDVHNKMIDNLASEYGGEEKIPIGAYPPILDHHEGDSNDRVVGRLSTRLEFQIRDIPKVGKNVPCAVAKPGITFLGKDTVEKVKDGRIYHLSVGINEEDDSLGETSTVIEPAAPGAMLLKNGSKSKGDAMPKMDIKRLKAHTERLAKLGALNESLKKLVSSAEATSSAMKQAKREGEVNGKLVRLCGEKKMTPAEYKNLTKDGKLVKLAKLDDESLSTALSVFECREAPVIQTGQRGSTDAMIFSDIAKDVEAKGIKRLKAEVYGDIRRLSGKKLSGLDDKGKDTYEMGGGNKEEPVHPGNDPHDVPGQAGDEKQLAAKFSKHMSDMKKHLEAGNMDEAKKCYSEMAKHCESYGMKHMAVEDVKSEDSQKHMAGLQSQVDELNTQMSRMAGMVSELMSQEKEEGHEFKEDPEGTQATG